jgi:glycosyltransferase involved in cell wall biosynthesis
LPETLTASATPGRICLLANLAIPHSVRWANHFHRKGYDVHVISLGEGHGVLPGISIHRLKKRLPFKLDYFREVQRMRKVVASIRPAFVHAHYASGYGTLGRLIGFHPYIVSVWGSDIYEFPHKSPVHRWLLKRNLEAADYLCSTSQDMAREAKKHTSKPILITPFGVDCELFSPGSAPRSEKGELVIGTVRSLEESYGIDILLKAFRLLTDRLPDYPCKLVIVGGGTLEAEYRRLADKLGLGATVRFAGRVPHDRVPEYLRTFSVFAALSRWESFGVAALEASSCGVPVVVTSVGGLPEVVVDGETGMVVPPNDLEAAAQALQELVLAPSLRERMGRAAQKWVAEHYRWEETTRVMERLYERVISGKTSSPQMPADENLASAMT